MTDDKSLQSHVEKLEALIAERDRLYSERHTSSQSAVTAALVAAKEQTNAAFAASEKAIGKAEINAEKWRENANEWRSAMMDREIKFSPRSEVENEFKSLRQEIAGLAKSRDEGMGSRSGTTELRAWAVAVISVIVALFSLARAFGP